MKLTVLFSCLLYVTSFANTLSQSTKLSLNFQNAPFIDLIEYIEEHTAFYFIYEDNVFKASQTVTLKAENEPLESIIRDLADQSEVDYQIYDSQIVLTAKKRSISPQAVLTAPVEPEESLQPQKREITGKVTDKEGLPLIGLTVVEKGTTNGVITDKNGNYSIHVQEDAEALIFSYVGMGTEEVNITGRTIVNIEMSETAVGIEEVVAIGYGTIKKKDLTGSVGTVTSDELASKGLSSLVGAIQGSVAGVNVTSNSAKPGGGFSIEIRGRNSLGSSNPLYVVDGIITSDIEFLNPADIERIDILKDASSTAIYGSRGSNGVVMVQTKNAQALLDSRITVTYSGYYGVRQVARIPDFQDGREFADYRTSAFYKYSPNNGIYVITEQEKLSVLQGSKKLEQKLYEEDYTDWIGLGTQLGRHQNHFLNIQGKANQTSYVLGFGYQNETGNFLNESLERYNLKLGVDGKVSDKFSTGGTFNMVSRTVNMGSELGYKNILRMNPLLEPYDDAGNIVVQPGFAENFGGTIGNFTSAPNPLIEIESGNREIRRIVLIGNIFASFTPVKGLNIRSTLSPYFDYRRDGSYYGAVPSNRNTDEAEHVKRDDFSLTIDNMVNYVKDINNHHINFTFVNSIYHYRMEEIQIAAIDFPFNSEWYNMFAGTLVIDDSRTRYQETSMLSFSGRLNYNFKEKYLFTGTGRYDGSSKLAEKWAFFPSFALAWRISQEDFMSANFLNELKARLSFGYSGNNNVGPYSTIVRPQTETNVLYDFGGVVMSGFAPGNPVNQVLTWEKTRELNLGIDFGLFNNRIYGNIEMYDKLSDGLLMSRRLAIESGVNSMIDNIGSVSNKGIEAAMTTGIVSTEKFRISTSFTFSRNKNAIVSLYGSKQDVPGEKRFIGEPIEVIYDYRIIGIWRSDQIDEAASWGQQPGQAIANDVNGDGKISPDEDREILGTPFPSWIGGLTLNMKYSNWDLSCNLFTQQGRFLDDMFLSEWGYYNDNRGQPQANWSYFIPAGADRIDWQNFNEYEDGSAMLNWAPAAGNEDSKYPAIRNPGPYYGDNGKYTEASFVRFKNIILGYTLPDSLIRKIKIQSCRIYFNVVNPFLFTDYPGWDPEYGETSFQDGNGPGNITYQLGLDVKF